MRGYVDELLPILLEFLTDASSSQKRELSLWTLSQLVESTGLLSQYVILHYCSVILVCYTPLLFCYPCIYIYKVVISVCLFGSFVCLFVCLFVRSELRNPLTDLPQIWIVELGRTPGMFLAWFKIVKLSGLTIIYRKISFQTKLVPRLVII